ncbi:MAG: hypothetical protein JO170_32750 [Verrucomicrobia bacterium]|nr:hypothetical protein [Verrucomicrobiota bacterium]
MQIFLVLLITLLGVLGRILTTLLLILLVLLVALLGVLGRSLTALLPGVGALLTSICLILRRLLALALILGACAPLSLIGSGLLALV